MDLPPVQRRQQPGAPGAEPGATVAPPTAGTGAALPAPVRDKMERSFGADFSAVRVHEGAHASAIGALGYTQGHDIHFAPGQYQPNTPGGQELLGHELAHVVQQAQGRVATTGQAKGAEINSDPALEREADEQGARAARGEPVHGRSGGAIAALAGPLQRKVIQRKDVPTHYGTFKTTTLEKLDHKRGVRCTLEFEPDENKIDAKKIGLSQSIKITNRDGSDTAVDPTKEARRVKSGPGKDYTLDRVSQKNNPILGAPDLAPGHDLDKTPQDNNWMLPAPTQVGVNASFELGHAYTDGGIKKKNAAMHDRPAVGSQTFETTALGLEGTDKDKYFGSVTWGFKAKDKDIDIEDITLASMGTPTQKFLAAAALWNTSKVRGTLEVIADPAKALRLRCEESVKGRVYHADGPAMLAKGTRVTQFDIPNTQEPMVDVRTMNEPTVEYRVKVTDLRDIGTGGPTIALPVPEVFVNGGAPLPLFSNAERTVKIKDLPARTRMTKTAAPLFDSVRDHDRTEKLAHSLWEKRGRPGGSPTVDWSQAESILRGSCEVKIVDGPDIETTGHVDAAALTRE